MIGIIVGFRNNSAYSRWWEGRTLWGQIVNNSRSPRQTGLRDPAERAGGRGWMAAKIVHSQIAFAHALRQALRGLDPLAEIRGLVSEEDMDSV